MKKSFFVAIAVMAFGFANAQEQIAKGKWLIETNTGFGVGNIGGTSSALWITDGQTSWNIGVEGGYFIVDRLAVKVGLGYGDNGKDNSFSCKIGGKYYVLNKFPVEVSYTGQTLENYPTISYLGLQGGYAWFVSKNISIEPGVRYNIGLNDYKDVFQFNVGFALHF